METDTPSIFGIVDAPTRSSIRDRDRWLYKSGKTIVEEDVLGIPDGEHWYSVVPLSRVWDWDNTPYDPPLSGNDWYLVIMGMPESSFKREFLIKLSSSIMGESDDSAIQVTLDTLRYSQLVLTFDIYTDTYEIV